VTSPYVLSDDEVREALKIAQELIDAGIPVFAAAPDLSKPGHYHLPAKWQLTMPATVWLERWQPGWALAAVGGVRELTSGELGGADFLDIDPRNGGDASLAELTAHRQVPRSFGRQATPSGGTHDIISATGERKAVGFMPGVDLQSGAPDGTGRGFVWISPTVRPSKSVEDYADEDSMHRVPVLRPYRWIERPDMDQLAEWRGSDDSTEGIIARVYSARAARRTDGDGSSAAASNAYGVASSPFALPSLSARAFTAAEAQEFCRPALTALQAARVGEIEERCNAAAAQLSHFVPAIWTADRAMAILRACLAETAYDENHPASTWTVEKFRPVLTGARPVADPWKATLRAEPLSLAPEIIPEERGEQSRADWLEGQILTADEIAERPAPVPLVYGRLNMNSEAWIIGAPGSFKSFIALDLAAHVAGGREWHGHRVRRERVLYLAAEGAEGMTLRARAWRKIHGPMAGVDFLPLPMQVTKTEDWAALVEVAARRGYGLIVVDTQARVTKELDENAARDAGIYIDAVTALRVATGACVLTVHHTGRKGGDARGSSAIDGAQDSEIKLDRIVPRSSMRVRLRDDKQKDMAEDMEGVELLLQVVDLGTDPETGQALSSLVVLTDEYVAAERAGVADVDHGQVETIGEPGRWTHDLFGHQRQETKRRILQVLRDAGGQVGLTEAKTLALVAEKWHGGKVGNGAGEIKKANFQTYWSDLLVHVLPSGEFLILNPSGEKRAVNPAAWESDE